MDAVTAADPLAGFRQATREWLEANCPASMRTPMVAEEMPWGGRKAEFPNPDSRLWLDRMAARGWTAPRIPAQYGGGGLDAAHAAVLQEELGRINARLPIYSFGLWMLAPVLLEYGTEDQKQRFLPDIVRGGIRWCQGYSEPNAGSDLASLRTRAVRDGEAFVVTGSKIWTSYSDKSDWIFCLVRTDPDAPKHAGISFLLFDLETPGVVRRPIDLISGESPFCETFFDEVRVPAGNLVGPLNGGWEIAKRLLQYERQNVAGAGFGAGSRRALGTILRERAALSDPVVRDRVAHELMHAEALSLFTAKNEARVAAGQADALVSVVKVLAAKANQARSDVLIDAVGLEALVDRSDPRPGGDPAGHAEMIREAQGWLRSRANSIEGGTSEINLNILARAVIGLPSA
jgi:alkylation response protein AidB-like acyl-CoA dehydrogenase